MTTRLEQICLDRGMRMSGQRRVILQILDRATDHPSAEEVYQSVIRVEPSVSLATVYRTLNLLAEAGILTRVELGDGRAHYEKAGAAHHEHLIDVETGKVLEFSNGGIEALLREAAGRLGYRLLKYRLELFAAADKADGRFVDGSHEPGVAHRGRRAKPRGRLGMAGAG